MSFALPAVVLVAGGVLAHSAAVHLRHPAAMAAALNRQDLLPRRSAAAVVCCLGPAEGALALGAVAALTFDRASLVIGAGLAAAGAAFATFLLVLHLRRSGTPCGCAGEARPPGGLAAMRAIVVLTGGVALLGGAADRLRSLDAGEAATVVVAAATTALALELATIAPWPPAAP